MTVALRVIPCLDVDAGRVVKGVNFENLRDAGDPVELAKRYDAEGADELTFLDITASSGERQTTYDVVRGTAEQVFIPLTVGGGVRSTDDVNRLLRAGADKVGVNTAAIARPELIGEIAERFGSQVLVLSVDARRTSGTGGHQPKSGFEVTTHGGRQGTGIDALEWIAKAQQLGAGEILLNSMDADGTASGFDIELIPAAAEVPVACPSWRVAGRAKLSISSRRSMPVRMLCLLPAFSTSVGSQSGTSRPHCAAPAMSSASPVRPRLYAKVDALRNCSTASTSPESFNVGHGLADHGGKARARPAHRSDVMAGLSSRSVSSFLHCLPGSPQQGSLRTKCFPRAPRAPQQSLVACLATSAAASSTVLVERPRDGRRTRKC